MANFSSLPQGATLSAKESLLYKTDTHASRVDEEIAVTVESVGDLLRYTFWHFTQESWQKVFEQDQQDPKADWALLYIFLELVGQTREYEMWVREGSDLDMQHRSIGLKMLMNQIHNAMNGQGSIPQPH